MRGERSEPGACPAAGRSLERAVLLALAVALAAGVVQRVSRVWPALAAAELAYQDHVRSDRPPPDASPVVVCPIDEASLEDLGGAPMLRRHLARALGALSGAGAVGLVLPLAGPAWTPPPRERLQGWTAQVEAALESGQDPRPALRALEDEVSHHSDDASLAEAIEAHGRVVLAAEARDADRGDLPAGARGDEALRLAAQVETQARTRGVGVALELARVGEALYPLVERRLRDRLLRRRSLPSFIADRELPVATTVQPPLAVLCEAAAGLAVLGSREGPDGPGREGPLLFRVGGAETALLPSLALAMACVHLGVDPAALRLVPGSHLLVPGGRVVRVPLDGTGRVRPLRSATRGGLQELPFRRLLDPDEAVAGAVEGRPVLLGMAPGGSPGPELLAQAGVLDAILSGNALRGAPREVDLLIIVLSALGGALAALGWPGTRALAGVALAVLAPFVVARWATGWGWVTAATFPAAAAAGSCLAVRVQGWLLRRRYELALRRDLGRQLHPAVLEEWLDSGAPAAPAREVRELTVLCCRAAGAMSAQPEVLAWHVARSVLEGRGTLERCEAAAFRAFWGAPLVDPRGAERACLAALDAHLRLDEARSRGVRGGPAPALGLCFGIQTLTSAVGPLGPPGSRTYAVLGEVSGVAGHVESLHQLYGSRVIIDEPTWERARGAVEGRELDRVRFERGGPPVRLYELLAWRGGLTVGQQELCGRFHAGVEAYRAADWYSAIGHFEAALGLDGADVASRDYMARCRGYLDRPPRGDWDGVRELASS